VNGLKRGDPAKVLIRPESLVEGFGQSNPDGRAGHEISGTVCESFFAGTDYHVVLACKGLPPVRASLRAGPGTSHHTIGEQTSLFVPHDAVHLIPGKGAPA
jgi:spermidine/putrescine transport system ATP-binding protein